MSKVMVSIPDDLLGALDAEAERRRTTRRALLQAAARRELGLLRRERQAVLRRVGRLLLSADRDLLDPGLAIALPVGLA